MSSAAKNNNTVTPQNIRARPRSAHHHHGGGGTARSPFTAPLSDITNSAFLSPQMSRLKHYALTQPSPTPGKKYPSFGVLKSKMRGDSSRFPEWAIYEKEPFVSDEKGDECAGQISKEGKKKFEVLNGTYKFLWNTGAGTKLCCPSLIRGVIDPKDFTTVRQIAHGTCGNNFQLKHTKYHDDVWFFVKKEMRWNGVERDNDDGSPLRGPLTEERVCEMLPYNRFIAN